MRDVALGQLPAVHPQGRPVKGDYLACHVGHHLGAGGLLRPLLADVALVDLDGARDDPDLGTPGRVQADDPPLEHVAGERDEVLERRVAVEDILELLDGHQMTYEPNVDKHTVFFSE